jgi:hypothetical protein
MGTIYMIEDQIPEIKRSPWVDNFFRPLLITTMIMCFNFSLVNLVHFINPAWRSIYFLAGMLLTTVEAFYSYRILKHWKSRDISRFRYRLAEGVLLLFVLKLLSFGNKSVADIWAELQEMWVEPLTFLNLEFYMLVSLAFIAWIIATYTIGDFEALYDPYTFRTDNILPLHELTARFLWGGVLLVVISGISQWVARAGLSSLTNLQRPSLNGVILNVLLYFVLGLVLLSQANLTRLMVRWRVQKIEVAPSVVKQWAKYALAFLVVVAGLVFFLPTSYTLGFLASAALVVQFLLQIIIFIIQLILFLISLPFVWLFSFLEVTPTAQDLGAAPAFPTLPPSDANAGPLWFEVLRSLLFWLVVLGSVGYLVRVYLNDHPDLLASLQKF